MAHPAMKRAWLQTGGLPVDDIHADLRAEFDRVHHVEWIGGGCFKLFDDASGQIGIMQFQPPVQARIDAAIWETTQRLEMGASKPANIAAGDTVVRSLNMKDPTDVALMQNALSNAESNVIVPDPERQDPPPINLPDYTRPPVDYANDDHDDYGPEDYERPLRAIDLVILAFIVALCAAAFYAMHYWGAIHA